MLSMSDRCKRPCNSCAFYDTMDFSPTCVMRSVFGYDMDDERTATFYENLDESLPCRFHMTIDEFKQHMDSLFM